MSCPCIRVPPLAPPQASMATRHGRVIGEVLQELRPRQPHIHELARLQLDPAQLKYSLRDIHADDGSGKGAERVRSHTRHTGWIP